MWKKILLAVALLVVAAVAFVAIQPSTFRVARAAVMAAPAGVVYAQIADFHAWQAWSPWEKLDPNQRREISGPPSGKGAVYFWSGNDQVGEGRLTIVEARPGRRWTSSSRSSSRGRRRAGPSSGSSPTRAGRASSGPWWGTADSWRRPWASS